MKTLRYKQNLFFAVIGFCVLMLFGAGQTHAQPSDAQIKKQLTSPKTVSITLGAPGTVEWSSTYKKYVWSRNFTVKLKTDTPGEILIVKGYASYDVIGGRYVYWRTFTSSNSYAGKKNPTVDEINAVLAKQDLFRWNGGGFDYIGEYESMRLAPEPEWEWHTPDSVSFNVVAVFTVVNKGGLYADEEPYRSRPGFKAIDKIEAFRRLRLYRKASNLPWETVGVSNTIPISANTTKKMEKLIDRKVVSEAELKNMPRMTKVPQLTP
ncbi:MAG: hypothetical protein ACKVQJ_01715 [Pyrinomonadaceae bacterium]